MNWIKTSDETPDMNIAVLACFRDKCYIAYVDEDGDWWLDDGGEPCMKPTHWMPLPEPPK